jgi:hypothetical protein
MRPEIRCLAAFSTWLLAVSGSSAASPPAKPEPASSEGPRSISDALCGRGSSQRLRAEALDRLDTTILPEIWGKLKLADFERWLEAPICLDATPTEDDRFEHRRKALGRLRSQIERARTLERVEAALASFRGWKPRPDPWPSSSECRGCAELRDAAARVAVVTASWPERKLAEDLPIGKRLAAATQREPLMADLCAAEPSQGAQDEILRSFRYYSWTSNGAKLLEVAALFKQPEVVAGCRP